MMRGKGGKGGDKSMYIFYGVIAIVVLAILFAIAYINFDAIVGEVPEIKWLDSTPPNINWNSPVGLILTYLFGVNETTAQTISALIILIAVWLIFFLSFGDIIDKFGMFSKGISWTIGLALAVILANAGFYWNLLTSLMAVFAFLAGFAVIAALASIFVAMFVVHWGLTSWAPWLMHRRALMVAAEAEAGGEELSGVIAGLKSIGSSLRKK